MKKIIPIILAIHCSVSCTISPQPPKAAPNISIQVGENITILSNVPNLPIVEPHLSVHPNNLNHLLVAAMIIDDKSRPYETARLATFTSNDAGNTWVQTDWEYKGYDPWTVILPNGRAIMTWLGTPKTFDSTPVQVFTSPNGGRTWDAKVSTLQGEYDGTKMTFDYKTNTILFTSVKFKGHESADIYFNKNPNGEGFGTPTLIDGKGKRYNFAQPVALSDGTIVVPSSLYDEAIFANISNDGGKTFNIPIMISTTMGGGKGYHQFAADVSNSVYKDRMYYVRANGFDKDYKGIWLNYSADKGKTWSKDIRVDKFSTSYPCKALTPSVAVNKDGILGISWVDRQYDINKNDLYFTISTDGGNTFHSPVRITDVSSNPNTAKNDDVANKFPGGGHYLALTTKPDSSFQLVWSDSRTGVFQLQTCNVKIQD
ncbi:MAG: sialidase family protein [Saprospiraceae bacterium]|nr:sialidase family protein [Saprospiraceae bacterium]